MYYVEEVLATLLGLFGAFRSDSAPGELCPPCPLRYAPACGSLPTKWCIKQQLHKI